MKHLLKAGQTRNLVCHSRWIPSFFFLFIIKLVGIYEWQFWPEFVNFHLVEILFCLWTWSLFWSWRGQWSQGLNNWITDSSEQLKLILKQNIIRFACSMSLSIFLKIHFIFVCLTLIMIPNCKTTVEELIISTGLKNKKTKLQTG